MVEYLRECQGNTAIAHFVCRRLKSNDRNEPIEEADDIEESRCDFFGDDDGDVLSILIAKTFKVPVLERSDDVRLIDGAELYFYLVPCLIGFVGKEQVSPPTAWLHSLLVS